jgi:hypothetical protein
MLDRGFPGTHRADAYQSAVTPRDQGTCDGASTSCSHAGHVRRHVVNVTAFGRALNWKSKQQLPMWRRHAPRVTASCAQSRSQRHGRAVTRDA